MKISRNWLQSYFDSPLPDAAALAEALTFHAFEIDGLEKHQDDDVLDVKVTPNRGHDCLSHICIAKEISAILSIPLNDQGRGLLSSGTSSLMLGKAPHVIVKKDAPTCSRFLAAHMKGAKVGPSPEWLVKRLSAIGQRSINTIVDATNYAMFSVGQPLHAFDATTLSSGETFVVGPRMARTGESLVALDGKTYALSPERMVIAGGAQDAVLGIAGVKGGKDSGVTDATTEIIIEAATFDGVSVRKTARALDLRTDASQRFEQGISPILAERGLRACIALIRDIAGGELVGTSQVSDASDSVRTIVVSAESVNRLLGMSLKTADVENVLQRLGFDFEREGDRFSVQVPPERIDLTIEEDMIEEIGRIVGFDAAPAAELPPLAVPPAPNRIFALSEAVRDQLVAEGFSEVYTSVFAENGDRAVLNKVGGERPFLRTSLIPGLQAALKRNQEIHEILGPDPVQLFEIGTVWKGTEEVIIVARATKKGVEEQPLEALATKDLAYSDAGLRATKKYEPFSRYPFIVRDIALWVPTGTEPEAVLELIREHAGDLLMRSYQFDSFTKGDRTSFAFRLVFQSFDRTLFDDDANTRMQSVVSAVTTRGYEVR
jgi:phenylalanyl-tRNA synthetase beta chain